MMKKYITISLFIFWAITVAILVSGLIFYDKNNSSLSKTTNTISATTSTNIKDSGTKKNPVPTQKTPPVTTTPPNTTPKSTTTSPNTTTPPPTNNPIILNVDEIAKHNSPSDCWLLISGNVYNVTSYLNMHPAGADAIIPYCGQDATVAFDTKGGRGQSHSGQANSILQSYIIGQLNQTVSLNQTPVLSPNNPANAQTPRGEDSEDDD